MSDAPDIRLTQSELHDPLLAGMTTPADLFGGMLTEPVDAQGNAIPQPDISRHPTRGICRRCGSVMPRAHIAFCGGWTPLRECDSCAEAPRAAYQRTARKAEARERTEPSYA